MENLHKGHRERLKNKFLKNGLSGFEHHNILELLLFYSIPRKDTNEIAHKLISRFGSFSAVFDAKIEELLKIDGITMHSAVLLKLIPNLASQYMHDKADVGTILQSTDDIARYLQPYFIGKTHECVYCICLDSKLKVIKTELMFEGSVNSVGITNRKILEFATANNATAIVLSHNHPNGVAIPSSSDVRTTMMLKEVLIMLDITLLDHIIVADNGFISFVDSNLL